MTNPTRFSSTDDKRTQNSPSAGNSVRHTCRTLTDQEKAKMQEVEDLGQSFIDKLHEIGGTTKGGPPQFGSRDLSLANTHIEEAVMRAVRHITA